MSFSSRCARALTVLLLLCLPAGSAVADAAPAWPPGTAEDMRIFEPYIGSWIGGAQAAQPGGGEVQFVVTYAWFDAKRTVVKLTIKRRPVDGGGEALMWEGFYGVHPTERRLYYFGANVAGVTAIGGVSEFDLGDHRRVTVSEGVAPDGTAVRVRDEFTLAGPNAWRSVTRLKRGDQDWRVIGDDTYTRLEGS